MPRRGASSDARPTEPVRSVAIRLLARRDLTRAELTSRLLDRGYANDVIDAALDELTRTGALDDRRAARAHVRTASRVKGRGRLRIRRELEARGVEDTLIREALAELPAEQDAEIIAKILTRKRTAGDGSPAAQRRLFQQLLRRGFPANLVAKSLKDWPKD